MIACHLVLKSMCLWYTIPGISKLKVFVEALGEEDWILRIMSGPNSPVPGYCTMKEWNVQLQIQRN